MSATPRLKPPRFANSAKRPATTPIGGFFLACGYSDEYMHVFLARELVEDPLAGDDDEELHLERVPLDNAFALVDAGEAGDAKTVAAIMLYLRHERRGSHGQQPLNSR